MIRFASFQIDVCRACDYKHAARLQKRVMIYGYFKHKEYLLCRKFLRPQISSSEEHRFSS